MMKANIKEILIRSLDASITKEEEGLLKDYERGNPLFVREKERLLNLRKVLSGRKFDFPEDFTDRVMQKVYSLGSRVVEHSFSRQITKVFWWASTIAAAAVVLIILSIYIREGSLNMDAITGMDKISSDNLSAFLLFDY